MTAWQAFPGKLKRAIKRLWYYDIWHLQPSAPFNWRYILPKQSAQIKMYRHLWWHSRYKLPGLLWLPLELMRVLHWKYWAASRRVELAVTYYGAEVEARFGIPVNQQRDRIGYWAKTWCINPYIGYNWQLYQADADGLAVIYDNQASAYHALQNQKTGATKADHRLLGDKIKLAEKLSAIGIPMVSTAQVSQGDWQDVLTALAKHSRLFCKLRSGNQGESAFAVWQAEQGLCGQALEGKQLPDEASLKIAWQTLSAKGQVLIQPYLHNHPALASAAADAVAITLRVVTRVGPNGISVWWAELQVPGELESNGTRGFWRFPVAVTDGAVSVMPKECLLKQDWQDDYDALWQRLSVMDHVPYWEQVSSLSVEAHRQLPKVWAIAWDWVITPNGPILLEGNSGWGLEQAQMQLGGFNKNLT